MKRIITCLILLGVCSYAHALTVPSWTSLTLGSINVAENIIVEPNATLIIDGDPVFGHPSLTDEYYILIQDKGKVISNGGSISGLDLGGGLKRQWYGIIVESTDFSAPTTTTALDLNNFRIENARHGIEIPRFSSIYPESTDLITPRINISNSVFDNNNRHVFMGTAGYLFGTAYGDFNQKNGINILNFFKTEFLGATSSWSFWITHTRNILIRECLVDDDIGGTDYGFHFNGIDYLGIMDCIFKRSGTRSIVFHGYSDFVSIRNCGFIANLTSHPEGLPYNLTGVSVGANTSNEGAISNFEFVENYFDYVLSYFNDEKSYGLVVGYLPNEPGVLPSEGNIGYIHNGAIERNNFFGCEYPIGINNSTTFHILGLFATYPKLLKIKNNFFQNYYVGMTIGGRHEGTTIECHWFHQGDYGLVLENENAVLGPSYLPGFTSGTDTGNIFLACSTMDVYNETTTLFTYERSTSNVAPPSLAFGPFSFPWVVPILTCNNLYPY